MISFLVWSFKFLMIYESLCMGFFCFSEQNENIVLLQEFGALSILIVECIIVVNLQLYLVSRWGFQILRSYIIENW